MTKTPLYGYELFGFSVASEFELPELGAPAETSRDTGRPAHAVQITRGSVPDHLEGGHKIENFLDVGIRVPLGAP